MDLLDKVWRTFGPQPRPPVVPWYVTGAHWFGGCWYDFTGFHLVTDDEGLPLFCSQRAGQMIQSYGRDNDIWFFEPTFFQFSFLRNFPQDVFFHIPSNKGKHRIVSRKIFRMRLVERDIQLTTYTNWKNPYSYPEPSYERHRWTDHTRMNLFLDKENFHNPPPEDSPW